MGKPPPMASDPKKPSNLLSPTKKLSKKPPTHPTPSTTSFPLDDHRKKQNSAETRRVRECRPPRPKTAKTAPAVDDPVVRFNFGDDYGNYLFLELRKELAFERNSYGRRLSGGAAAGTECCSGDVYRLSEEEEMIGLFLRENLL